MTTSFEIPHDRHRSPLGDLLATGGSLVHQEQKAPQAAPHHRSGMGTRLGSSVCAILRPIEGWG
jgi:hypothetical protein